MKIYAACFKGVSLVSRTIRWVTRGDYSHVGILLPDNSIIEAWHKGGVLHNASISAKHTKGTVVDVFEFEVSEAGYKRGMKFLTNQLGKKYDFASVAKFVTKRKPKDGTTDRWFCSELFFQFSVECYMPVLANTVASEVPPHWIPRSPLGQYLKTLVA